MASQRRNPLTGEWIIISPHRLLRPWKGEKSKQAPPDLTRSYLSPGATRSNGEVNPEYEHTYVFPNDFPALIPKDGQPCEGDDDEDELFSSLPATGECHVMCFSPDPALSLPTMSVDEIVLVIEEWRRQCKRLSHLTYVQVFENKGAIVGCSNSHPHCQIWASDFVPHEIQQEDQKQLEYYTKHGTPLLCSYLEKELVKRDRVVEEGRHWVALVPYWAKYPYELLVLPKRHITKLDNLTQDEVIDLAVTMKKYLIRFDNKFECSFPYSMGWHCAPNVPNDTSHWQLHAHYYPPLLRSASVKKHIAGYELLAQCQRDITAETAAQHLRDCDNSNHYAQLTETHEDHAVPFRLSY